MLEHWRSYVTVPANMDATVVRLHADIVATFRTGRECVRQLTTVVLVGEPVRRAMRDNRLAREAVRHTVQAHVMAAEARLRAGFLPISATHRSRPIVSWRYATNEDAQRPASN